VWVRFAPATTDTPPEVGYAIGRAVGTAVVRNRLRRRLRAVIAELSPSMAPGAYLVGAAPAVVALGRPAYLPTTPRTGPPTVATR
jgi:ribonuclease P protein component